MDKQIIILGVPIDDLNMDQALDRLDEFIEVGRKEGKSHHIATINADFAVKARTDPELRRILLEIDMATADGMPLVWGARLLGMHLEGRVTGADLVPALAERSAQKGHTLYFLGAGPGVAAKAAEILEARYPGVKIVGIVSPPKSPILEMDPQVVEDIKEKKPDILLVAFGNPKQEKWISLYREELAVPVMIGVGGTFDFIAGRTKRAPEWMQKTGLEWVFRLAQEPNRLWKRYVTDMRVFTKVFVQQWWLMRQGQAQTQGHTPINSTIVEDAVITNRRAGSSGQTLQAVESVTKHITSGISGSYPGSISNSVIEIELSNAETGLTQIEIESISSEQSNNATIEVIALSEQNESARHKLIESENSPLSENPVHTQSKESTENQNKKTERNSQQELASLPAGHIDTPVPTVSNAEPTQISHSTTVLHLQGRLDIGNVTAFTEKGQAALLKTPNLIINLSRAEFLDSRALGAIVGLTKQARKAGGELWLVEVPPTIFRVLSLLRLDRFFKIEDNIEAIIDQLSGQTSEGISKNNFGQWAIVRIPERLDGNNVEEMISRGIKQLSQTPRLVLDFSQTSFLASAGLAAMLKLNRQSQAIGGEIRLAACSDDVLRTIEMARFDKVLPLYPSVQAACN